MLKEWQQVTFKDVEIASVASIFQNRYFLTTLYLSMSWFMINFMYYGQLIILPFIYGKENATFSSYILTIVGEAPSLIVSFLVVDRPGFGRKRSLTAFFGFAGLMHLIFASNFMTIFSSASRFFMKLCFQMLYPFTTESYGTLNRTIGFGYCSAFGRVGATVMPYIVFPLLEISKELVFVSFVVVSLLGMVTSNMVPNETLGAGLDSSTSLG